MIRKQRKYSVFMALALLAAVISLPATPAAAAGSIDQISATSGQPGDSVTVTGSGFAIGDSCSLYFRVWSDPAPSENTPVIASCTIGQDGGFNGSLIVSMVAPGDYNIWACNTNLKSIQCSSQGFSFTIDPPPTTVPPPTTTSTTTTTAAPTTTSTTTTAVPTTTSTTVSPAVVDFAPVTIDPAALTGPIPAGFGLGAGQFGTHTTLRTTALGVVEIPPEVVWRCAVPSDATLRDFDAGRVGLDTRLAFAHGEGGTSFDPAVGTISSPTAIRIDAASDAAGRTSRDGYLEGDRGRPGFGYIGLHVGLPEATAGPVTIRLVGSDDAGVIDMDDVVLGPDAAPATNCLVVKAAEGRPIQFMQIRSFGTDQPIMVDRVFTGESYPVSAEPIRFGVDISLPRDGNEIDAARTTAVVGVVSSPFRVPLDRVEILMTQCDHCGVLVREAELSDWIEIDAGKFNAVFALTGVHVPPGEHTFTAVASGALGTGSDSITLTGTGAPFVGDAAYRDSVHGIVDVVPWAMEVTQAIRGPLEVQEPGTAVVENFPLVSHKKTVVRGYALQQFPSGEPPRVQDLSVPALLYGERDGMTLPGSPLAPEYWTPTLGTGEPGAAAEAAARPSLHRSYDFVVPDSWTSGEVTLTLDVNPPGFMASIEEAPGTDGPLDTIARTVAFGDVGTTTVAPILVNYSWRCDAEMMGQWYSPCSADGVSVGDQVSSVPSRDAVRNSILRWWKTLPAAGDYPSRVVFSTIDLAQLDADPAIRLVDPGFHSFFSAVKYSEAEDAFKSLDCQSHSSITKLRLPDMRTFGMFVTPWGAPGLSGGCAWIGGHKVLRTSLPWWVMAQEAGHTAGMRHSSNAHDELGTPIIRWPGDHGELAQQPTWGFDTTTMTPVVADLGSHVHDYMSYGSTPDWTAVDTWTRMFDALARNRSIGEDRGRAASRGGIPGGGSDGETTRIVSGVVGADGVVEFADPYLGPAGSVQVGDGPTLVMTDASGATVFETTATNMSGLTHSAGDTGYWFEAEVPLDVEATGMSLLDDSGDRLGRFENLHGSATGGVLNGEIGASANSDGDAVTVSWPALADVRYQIEASVDGGSWWPVAESDGEPVVLRGADIGLAGAGWQLRVEGTDGVGVVSQNLDGIDFGPVAPTAVMAAPVDGQLLTPGVVHTSAVTTVLNNDVTYRWMMDGEPLSGGATAMLPLIEPGFHTIELIAENAAGTDSMSIEVNVGVDNDQDGLPDDWEAGFGLDPDSADDALSDLDLDGLTARSELESGTSPSSADTDGDDFSDSVELAVGSDPLDPAERPGFVHGTGVLAPRVSDGALTLAAAGSDQGDNSKSLPLAAALIGLTIALGLAGWLTRRRLVGQRTSTTEHGA